MAAVVLAGCWGPPVAAEAVLAAAPAGLVALAAVAAISGQQPVLVVASARLQ
jgi:hypothetical protein